MKEGLAATKQHPLPRTNALRMSSAVKCSEAGHDICKACFELPQAPYASDLWPAHDPMFMRAGSCEGWAAYEKHPLPRTNALRMSSAVKCPEASSNVCMPCFELPQTSGASDLWPSGNPESREGVTWGAG